jgi:hypothetical protein
LTTGSLLVSELVTNASLHRRGAIAQRIDRGVETCGSRFAHEGEGRSVNSAPGVSGGWGLRVVDRLAVSWVFNKAASECGSGLVSTSGPLVADHHGALWRRSLRAGSLPRRPGVGGRR